MNDSTTPDPGEPTTLPDADGHYSFVNLPEGDYEVTEVLPDGARRASKSFGNRFAPS